MSEQTGHSIDSLTQLHPSLWRAHQIGSIQSEVICSGHPELNQHLPGGGWAGNQCTELLIPHPGIGEVSFLIPALQRVSLKKKRVVFINPPFTPTPNVLHQSGISVQQLVLINACTEAQRLWAIDQVIQSNTFGALLAWLPENKKYIGHRQLLRLQHHASSSTGLSFLFRSASASKYSSPAALRIKLQAKPDNQLDVFILKRKGPALSKAITVALPRTGLASTQKPHQSQEYFDAMDRHLSSINQAY